MCLLSPWMFTYIVYVCWCRSKDDVCVEHVCPVCEPETCWVVCLLKLSRTNSRTDKLQRLSEKWGHENKQDESPPGHLQVSGGRVRGLVYASNSTLPVAAFQWRVWGFYFEMVAGSPGWQSAASLSLVYSDKSWSTSCKQKHKQEKSTVF